MLEGRRKLVGAVHDGLWGHGQSTAYSTLLLHAEHLANGYLWYHDMRCTITLSKGTCVEMLCLELIFQQFIVTCSCSIYSNMATSKALRSSLHQWSHAP